MARIVSTGSYLPEKIVTNDFFGKPNDPRQLASIEKYMTGMKERRHASERETGIYMGTKAAELAIERSSYNVNDIDLVIGTVTPNEYLAPEDLNLISYNLSCKNATVLPINTACSSFLSALNHARILLSSNVYKVILIVNSINQINYIVNKNRDYSMFGDGAGAVLLDNKENSFMFMEEDSDKKVFHTMRMRSPVFTKQDEYFEVVEDKTINMEVEQIKKPIDTARRLLSKTDIKPKHVFTHQAGVGMMEYWLQLMELDKNCLRHTFDKYTNMWSANIPVSLDYWINQDVIQRGDNILFFSPAAGAHYISIMWRY